VLTRLAAAGGVVQMLYAYFSVHVPMGGLIPIVNKGELALLFATAFLIVVVHGAKVASLEKAVFKKELF
jgi:putative oxidoreductase